MKYSNIIFLQGEEANEVINILEKQGEQKAFDYLQQWNYGESPIETNNNQDFTPWGTNDRLYKIDNYVMSYNLGIPYIGLTEINIKDCKECRNYLSMCEECQAEEGYKPYYIEL